jgi:AraC-like DNA-binding protein
MSFIVGISILAFTIMLIALVFFYFKKIKLIDLLFYTAWFLVFLCFYFSTSLKVTSNESLVATFVLLFFVWLILLPPLLYGVVLYAQTKTFLTIPHFYVSSVLLIINLFSLVFFSLNVENQKSFTYEVVENVITYVNYIVILFLFPVVTIYYSFLSYKILYHQSIKSKESFFLNKLFLFVLFYNLFVLFWLLTYVFDSTIIKYTIKSYFLLYFPLSIYLLVRFHVNKSVLEENNQFDAINLRLLDKIINKKIYLNSNLTLRKAAKEIDTNEKYLSNVINKIHHVSFSNFVNNYRVEHAKEMLLNSEFDHYTIESIGNLSGFNSKSNFNSVFKKTTGLTPTEYKTKAPVS